MKFILDPGPFAFVVAIRAWVRDCKQKMMTWRLLCTNCLENRAKVFILKAYMVVAAAHLERDDVCFSVLSPFYYKVIWVRFDKLKASHPGNIYL